MIFRISKKINNILNNSLQLNKLTMVNFKIRLILNLIICLILILREIIKLQTHKTTTIVIKTMVIFNHKEIKIKIINNNKGLLILSYLWPNFKSEKY